MKRSTPKNPDFSVGYSLKTKPNSISVSTKENDLFCTAKPSIDGQNGDQWTSSQSETPIDNPSFQKEPESVFSQNLLSESSSTGQHDTIPGVTFADRRSQKVAPNYILEDAPYGMLSDNSPKDRFIRQTVSVQGKTEKDTPDIPSPKEPFSGTQSMDIWEKRKENLLPKQKPSTELKRHSNLLLHKEKVTQTTILSPPFQNIPPAHRASELGKRKLIQEVRKNLRFSVPIPNKANRFFLKVTAAIVRSVQAVAEMLAGVVGGVVIATVILMIVLVAAVVASPFGILFSNEPYGDSIPLNAAIAQINMELSNRLDSLQAGSYDNVITTGNPPNWQEVVAVYASRTAAADDGMGVASFDAERVERLRTVFWDMCSVSSYIETIEHPDSDPEDEVDDGWTEQNLHITISARTAEQMRTIYNYTDYQNDALTELLSEMTTLNYFLGDLSISQEDAIAVLQNLPANLSAERRAVVQQALSLVGKVSYFWGGKSLVLGWDNRWGQLTKVTAPGSRTTGTIRPYGLDCSGFVDWVFYNASGGTYIIGHGGGAGAQHRYCTDIFWSEAQPGDLVFYYSDDHIGIVGGRDESGNLLIIHCASRKNNVVITGISGFISIARPVYYSE